MADRNPFCRDAAHVGIEDDLARVIRERDEAREQRDKAWGELRTLGLRTAQLFAMLDRAAGCWDVDTESDDDAIAVPVHRPSAGELRAWREVLDAKPGDPVPARPRPHLLGEVRRLAEAVSALQQTLTAGAPPDDVVAIRDGRRERWVLDPLPGGWICAEPDPRRPDGICGMPVESEPCEIHHPGAVAEMERRDAARDVLDLARQWRQQLAPGGASSIEAASRQLADAIDAMDRQ